jgi:hypothetical protein
VQIAQPSFLLGDRDQTRLVEEVGILAAKVIGPLLIGPLSKYRAIEAQLVAQALLRAVQTDKSGIHRLDYQALAAK